MTAVQERRLRELRSRVLVRAFDYRQRRHARGVWYRLRWVLAFAKGLLAAECFSLVPFTVPPGRP